MNVIPTNTVESERIAEIIDILPHCFMVDIVPIIFQRVRNAAGGGEVRDVIHQKIYDPIHKCGIAYFILLPYIPNNKRLKDIGNIVIPRLLIPV